MTVPELPAAELLRQHFDEAFSAEGGIKRLRELILTLAMQGKLVKQDPSEGTAAELLEQIAAEKKRLVKEGKIKAPKALPPMEDTEKPYDLPEGWAWVRLGDIGVWAIGSGFPHAIQGEQGLDVKLCKVSDMNIAGNEKYIVSTNNSISKEVAAKSKINVHGARTVIFPKIGGAIATNKRRIILDPTAIDNNCLGIRIWEEIDLEWAYKYLSGIDMQQYQVGTSVPALSQSTLEQIPTPLPPLAEQRRIVARIDQLMARCDELEALRGQQEHKRVQVHRAVLREVTAASDPAAFAEGWRFLADHFGELHATPKDLAELRGAILQLAVMGKLVPQDASEGTAAELLEQIQAEKKRLVKEGKIKAPKPLPPVTEAEQPYEVPQGWAWVRLGELVSKLGSGSTPRGGKEVYQSEGVPFLRSQNVWNDGLKLDDVVFISPEVDEKMSNTRVMPKDVLLNITGGSLGRSSLIPEDFEGANVSQHVTIIRAIDPLERVYLHRYILSPFCQKMVWGRQVGMAREGLSKQVLELFEFPLPPLAEQRRIVAKVDQLMGLCDVLQERLTARGIKQGQLLGAVMVQLAPPTAVSRPAATAGTGRRGRPSAAAGEASSGEKRGRGRPRKVAGAEPARSIPQASSEADAIRKLEAMRRARAEAGQVGLFEESN